MNLTNTVVTAAPLEPSRKHFKVGVLVIDSTYWRTRSSLARAFENIGARTFSYRYSDRNGVSAVVFSNWFKLLDLRRFRNA